MLASDTGELEEKILEHQGEIVREFYSALYGPILVGNDLDALDRIPRWLSSAKYRTT